MDYIIIGASGFIGSHFVEFICNNYPNNKIYMLDKALPKKVYHNTEYVYCDINKKINLEIDFKNPTLFHLAALCKEPGYKWDEYFQTNYVGTKNICAFALNNNIKKIIFTSSMSVYKPLEIKNIEEDLTAPVTAYGISKLLAEEVLLTWKNSNPKHHLKIVRPGIVFGKNENGNFTRLANSLRKNTFVFVGKKDTIKSNIYVKELINFLLFLENDLNERIIYNLVFPEAYTIESICKNICNVMKWKRYIPVLPFKLLLLFSYLFELLNKIGVNNSIHHRRIEKLFYSTRLSVDAALVSGYKFSYNLESALMDWKNDCGGKKLF